MKIEVLQEDQFEEFFEVIENMVSEAQFHAAKPDMEKIHWICFDSGGVVFVAKSNDKIVGFISGIINSYFFSRRERATDLGFYVAPEYRGSSAAIKLIRALENWAKEKGVEEVCLGQTTAVDIEKTQKFYAHLGYETVGFNTVKHLN